MPSELVERNGSAPDGRHDVPLDCPLPGQKDSESGVQANGSASKECEQQSTYHGYRSSDLAPDRLPAPYPTASDSYR